MKKIKSRILVLEWIEPTNIVRDRIKQRFPEEHIEIIEWEKIRGSIFRLARQSRDSKIHAIYFLCEDLQNSGQLPYLLGLSLFFKAEIKRLIDIKGIEQNCSWNIFLFKAIPRIFWGILLLFLIPFFNWIILKLLNCQWIIKRLKVDINNICDLEKKVAPICIGFFWAYTPNCIMNLKVGGEITHVTGFLSALKKIGYGIFLISTREILQGPLSKYNVTVDEKDLPAWPGEVREMTYNWKVLWKTRKLIRQRRFSLIYHRSSQWNFTGVLISIIYRIPLVVEFNSSDVWEAENVGAEKFINLLRLTERVSLTYATKVAVVSDEVRDYFVDRGVPSQKIIVNPNGVEPELFFPNEKGKKVIRKYNLSNKILVGFMGVFAQYHGILTLAEAIRFVVEEVNTIHFLIIGDGILRLDFENILKAHNVTSYVTITGKIPHKIVPEYLDACDILVSPHQNMKDGSTFLGSPTKIFEYMAMGKGIVASKIGQLEQILLHEENALLVKPADPKNLALGIIKLAHDSNLRKTLGQKAREHVLAYYTWEKNAERITMPLFGTGSRRK